MGYMNPSTMHSVKLSSKYQLVVPPHIRNDHGWKPGDEFRFIEDGDQIRVVRIPTFKELRGIVPANASVPFERDKEYGE